MSVRGAVSAIVSRADSWVNALTGLGTLRDKLTHAQVVPTIRLSDSVLETMYNEDDLAAKIVDKVPKEATRRGFRIDFEGIEREESAKTSRELQRQISKLQALSRLRLAWIWGRLYGAGAMFVGADDGQPTDQPLNEAGIKTIRFLTVLRKMQIVVEKRYEDPAADKYGEPEIFHVYRASERGQAFLATNTRIHESRLIVFPGALTARMFHPTLDGWDDSVLQRVHDVLRQTATSWQSTAHLLTDASQGVLKIANLIDLIATKDGEASLRTRIQMMDMARSVCRALLVDAEREEFERVATSFAGVPDLLDRFMMRAAAAAEMPVTILWGRSPAGMNATGESDVRGWYDTVEDAQTDILKPRLERLLRLMMLAQDGPTHGVEPETWELCFNPLWQPTAKESAEVLKLKSDAFAGLTREGIVLDAEAAIALGKDIPEIDVEARQLILEAELERKQEEADNPTPPPPVPGDPNQPPPTGGDRNAPGYEG